MNWTRDVSLRVSDVELAPCDEVVRQLRWCAGQPAVDDRFPQRWPRDLLQLDQDRRIPVEMGNREEGLGLPLRREHRRLLDEIVDTYREDGPIGCGLLAEAPDVGLAERPLPGERLPDHAPRAIAVPFSLCDLRQAGCDPRNVAERHRTRTHAWSVSGTTATASSSSRKSG